MDRQTLSTAEDDAAGHLEIVEHDRAEEEDDVGHAGLFRCAPVGVRLGWRRYGGKAGNAAARDIRLPHSSIGYRMPAAYAAHMNATGRPSPRVWSPLDERSVAGHDRP
jgi:hypothetical protein